MNRQRVALIGLGNMGAAIGKNLLRAGHDLVVWNRDPAKAKDLLNEGAIQALTPGAAASADIVLTMLADDLAVEAVSLGPDGILQSGSCALHVSMSTISVELADKLTQAHREAGSDFVSAPVFGRPSAAQAAKLYVVAAGSPGALTRAAPVLEAIGQRTFTVGPKPSSANALKLAGNFLLLSAIEALGEAAALAERHGVQPTVFFEILTQSLFPSPAYETYGRIISTSAYRPAGFPAPLALKDMRLLDQAASTTGVSMPLLDMLAKHLRATIDQEGPDVDWSAIARLSRKGAELDATDPRA